MAKLGESYIMADIYVTLEVPPGEYEGVDQEIYLSFNFHSTPSWIQEGDDVRVPYCETEQALRQARLISVGETIKVQVKHNVAESSKQFMSFAFCGSTANCPTCSVSFEGKFTFKNPYGFLRAAEFGLLPFSTTLCIFYVFAMLLFAFMYVFSRPSFISVCVCCVCLSLISFFPFLPSFFPFLP
jgi:hypothetical protein